MRPKIALCATAALVLTASPARAETLADAISLAYRSNPTIQSGRYDLRATNEDVVQARSELRPTANLEVTGGYDRTVEGRVTAESNPFSPTATGTNNVQAQVVVTQPLYTGGRATADRRTAEATVRAGRETLRSTEGDLLLNVVTAYLDVRRYAATLEVWKASVVDLEKLLREIEARQVAGELTRTDIAQAETQIDTSREQAVAAEQDLEAARTDYATLVGRDPGTLEPEPPLPQLPATVDVAFDLAEGQNPELAQARYTELASRSEIVAARAAGRPTVGIRGSATLNGEAYPYHFYNQDQGFVGSVVLTLPLTAGGLTASQIRQAEDRNDSDRLKIETARRSLDRNILNAWNQIVSAERQVRIFDMQRRSAATQLDGMINEYRVGLRSTFDLLYAQQTLTDAQVGLLGSERDRYIAQATLLRQAGLLEARAIMTGVELDDPSRAYRNVEHKNALPWDGAVAALDRIAEPAPHQKRLEQPGIASGLPAIVAPTSVQPADPDFARRMPTDPVPGTIGRPVSSSNGTLH